MKPHPIYTKAVAAAASSGKPAFADVSLPDTAKLIRATLKAKFPGVKFSVRSSRYAGGSSIDVRWNDGPGQSAVQDVIAPYASRGFDGMIDMAYCKGGWLYPDGSAGFRSSQGGQCSGGSAPAYKLAAASDDAIPARFGPSYVSAQRGKSVAYVAAELRAYAAAHADKLADAIRAGTVKAAGDDGYAYADGAQSIMVDEVGTIWGDTALHRFDCARLAAA